jgi:hypothetical protein
MVTAFTSTGRLVIKVTMRPPSLLTARVTHPGKRPGKLARLPATA